jgi:hypothetical protein
MSKKIATEVFFNSIGSNIRVIGTGIQSLFNIFDLSLGLSYHKSSYLKEYYHDKCGDIKIIDNEYIDFNDILTILNRGRKPKCKKLLEEILTYVNEKFYVIVSERIEMDIYKSINDFFDDDNIEIISNHKIDKYLPDIIIKQNDDVIVIIEINEFNHSICHKRMDKIKKKLKCDNFLNINPHDTNFSTGKLIKQILLFL